MTDLFAFTADQASRVTGLSLRQLAYWDKTGFFSPSGVVAGSRAYSRLYSFRNLVGLKAIALLRNKHQIPLQELRRVGKWLADRHDSPWASLSLFVAGKRIYFEDPSSGLLLDAHSGTQTVLPIELTKVAAETQIEVERLRARQPGDVGRIGKHRLIAHNQAVVAGTRVPASAIWNLHSAGYGIHEILSEYPSLLEADVKSAIAFVGKQEKAG
jgi:uncharacterized protein (DUF433 family)